jgi:4-hydroxybutyryl-CoA dehydratase/vinylacetyl-CoA-Delta-isomerase
MGLRTPQHYVESLRDGRVTYWDGERIDDITTHPRFRVPIALTAVDHEYDAPDYGALRRYRTEEGGEAHRIYQVPTSEADLATRVELLQHTSIGTAVSGVYMALMSVKDDVAQVNPQCAANIERMYRYCRDNDLRAAEVITDPKGDRKCRAHEQDDPDLYVRIVDRSFAPAALNEFDYPASAHHSMPEGFVVFDDVLVPWDRVFLAGEVQLASRLAQSLGLWERTGGVIEAVRLSELFVGLAQLVSEHQGKERDPVVMNTIAELITYAEMLRMSLDYACRHFEQSPSGMVFPNVLAINAAKYFYAANFHQTVRHLHDLSGGLVLTLPMEADLRHPEAGQYIRKYLHTKPDVDVEDRMRVYNLIRDLTADAYGGWQFVVALQAGGGLSAQRIMMNRTYDLARAKERALAAAGVKPKEAAKRQAAE